MVHRQQAEQKLKEKIEHLGKPLKDWDVKIYRGITTGLNEAFIIDDIKRQEILDNCKDEDERRRTENIIKPILRGRDIKRYYYEWAGLWVIVIPAGWTNKNKSNQNPELYIKEYFTSLMNHLVKYEEKAKKRSDQGDYWWELRACAYYSEFEKEKVVWAGVGTQLETAVIPQGVYLNAPANFMTGKQIKYLHAVLNSNLITWHYDLIKTKIGLKGGRFYIYDFLSLPIPKISESDQKPFIEIVDKILDAKKTNHAADTSEWEKEIDLLVYKLYELTEEEIAIVEREMRFKKNDGCHPHRAQPLLSNRTFLSSVCQYWQRYTLLQFFVATLASATWQCVWL